MTSSIYDVAGAGGQILLMLLVAFALGVLFGYLIRPPRQTRERVIHMGPARTPVSLPSSGEEKATPSPLPKSNVAAENVRGFAKLQQS